MSLTKVLPDLYVSPQIDPRQVEDLHRQGIRAIICNRPDDESPVQPCAAEVAAEAERLGIAFTHIPVIPGRSGQREVEAMAQALASLPRPLVAYCASGNRSGMMLQAALRAA